MNPRTRDFLVQVGLYLVVGAIATVVDLGGFAVLERLGLWWGVAAPISFVAGTLTNYFASYALAFRRGRFGRFAEIGRMAVVVAVGAGLNFGFTGLFMWLGASALLAKTIAIPCAFAWNFLGRRALVFHSDLPPTSQRVTERLLGAREEPPTP